MALFLCHREKRIFPIEYSIRSTNLPDRPVQMLLNKSLLFFAHPALAYSCFPHTTTIDMEKSTLNQLKDKVAELSTAESTTIKGGTIIITDITP